MRNVKVKNLVKKSCKGCYYYWTLDDEGRRGCVVSLVPSRVLPKDAKCQDRVWVPEG